MKQRCETNANKDGREKVLFVRFIVCERNYDEMVFCTFGIQQTGRCTDRQADGYQQKIGRLIL